MFDLEQSIADWRRQMLVAGIKTPVPLEELEIHLREDIERHLMSGANKQHAFESATRQIGQAKPIKMEFKKNDAKNWNPSLAWAAWILFVVSFFLPAFGNGLGWQCAGLSATAVSWSDFWHGNWTTIHLASLTLANLLMMASPFLFSYFAQNSRMMKWLRWLNFSALALVWSFLLLLITHTDRNDLKIGSYVWAVSFLPLCLSTLQRREKRKQYV